MKLINNNPDPSDDNRKILSVLSHASILLSSTGVSIALPIAILLLSEDSVVKENAKEALNFYISFYILAGIFLCLIFIVIGFPLLILLLVSTWVMPIIAIVKVLDNPHRAYRYPLIFHIL